MGKCNGLFANNNGGSCLSRAAEGAAKHYQFNQSEHGASRLRLVHSFPRETLKNRFSCTNSSTGIFRMVEQALTSRSRRSSLRSSLGRPASPAAPNHGR